MAGELNRCNAEGLSRCNERLSIQRFFAEFMQLCCIYGLNSHKTTKNTAFSYIIDIIPSCTANMHYL